jgi:hypothetical protein
MSWLNSIVISILSGIPGIFLGGLIGMGCVKWFRISSFEGGSGYAVVGIALLGGLVAVITGFIVAKWGTVEATSFFKGLLRAWKVVLMVAVVIAGVCRLAAGPAPAIESRTPVTTDETAPPLPQD